MTIQPDHLFEFWTPDEVAECLPVDDELYTKLWTLIPEIEQSAKSAFCEGKTVEYPECKWEHSLTKFWKRFSEDEQLRLNAAAMRNRREGS